jgi:hypothetical protein
VRSPAPRVNIWNDDEEVRQLQIEAEDGRAAAAHARVGHGGADLACIGEIGNSFL